MYTTKTNNAENPPYISIDLSSAGGGYLDVELIKIFELSIQQNQPYLINLDNSDWADWIKRRRKYWEDEKGVSVTYHHLTRSVYVVPMQ